MSVARRLAVMLLVLCVMMPLGMRQALAACTGPSGTAGDTLYNTDFSVLQFCNGTTWVGMGGSAGGSTPSGAAGYLQFSGGSSLASDSTVGGQLFWDSTNHALGVGTATPNGTAILDLTSTAKGFLPPRMTTAQRTAISSPAAGLVVYDTDLSSLYIYNGAAWGAIGSGTSVVSGTYTGNGAASQSINLGFRPKAVIVKGVGTYYPQQITIDGIPNGSGHLRSYATTGDNVNVINITATGFNALGNSNDSVFNNNGSVYYYVAFNTSSGGGGATPSGTAGYIQLSGGSTLTSDSTANGQFFWDATNHRLGIGTATPKTSLDIYGIGSGTSVAATGTTDATMNLRVSRGAVGTDLGMLDSGTAYIQNRNMTDFSQMYPLALQPNGGGVAIGTVTPSTKAILDLTSTTQGFLPPRMTTAQRTAIASPIAGLMVYDTDIKSLYAYNGTAWTAVGANGAYGTAWRTTTYTPAAIATYYDLPLDTADGPLSGVTHSTSTNAARMTVTNAGAYLVTYSAETSFNGASTNALQLTVNGTIVTGTAKRLSHSTAGYVGTITGAALLSLNAGDYVTMQVMVNVSGNTILNGNMNIISAAGGGSGSGGGATTILSGWPDAILCTSGSNNLIFYYNNASGGSVGYHTASSSAASGNYLVFTQSTGAYGGQSGATGYDCVTNSWSIAQLYANNKAFNLVGGSGSGSGSAADVTGAIQYNGGSSVFAGDAANFFWDSTNKRLGIGTNAPTSVLDVASATSPKFNRQFASDGNTSREALGLYRTYSGGPGADGIGVHIAMYAETETEGTTSPVAMIQAVATDDTAGTVDSDIYLIPYLDSVAQNSSFVVKSTGSIGIGTTAPAASAVLDVTSTTKGFLPPRMTTAQRTAIATPATGLVVYDTDIKSLYVYNGTAWAAGSGSGGQVCITDTADTLPTFTAATTSGYTVTASSIQASNQDGWYAFDNSSALGNKWVTASGTPSGILTVQFPSATIIGRYTIQASNESGATLNRLPKTWTFEGSNNGTSWTVIDTQPSQTAWGQNEKRTYTATNTTAYSYYRLNITSDNGDASIMAIGEVEMMVTNCYTVTGGSGGTTPSGSAGYVQLSGGSSLASDSTAGGQFFWDTTNHRLGIGTTSPSDDLSIITPDGTGDATLLAGNDQTNKYGRIGYSDTSDIFTVQGGAWGGTTRPLILQGGGGSVGVGTQSLFGKLNVKNDASATTGNSYGVYIEGAQSAATTGVVYGSYLTPSVSAATGTTAALVGAQVNPQNTGAGTITGVYGIGIAPDNTSTGTINTIYGITSQPQKSGTGAVSTMVGMYSQCRNTNATGVVTDCYALYLGTPVTTGVITNKFGVYQTDAASSNVFLGNAGVGTLTPDASAQLDVTSTTKGFLPPRMTTAQRTAISSPTSGLTVYDTDLKSNYVYNGTSWVSSSGMTLLQTTTISSSTGSVQNTTADFASFKKLYVEFNGISFTDTISRTFVVLVSSNAGTSWGAEVGISAASSSASDTIDGALEIWNVNGNSVYHPITFFGSLNGGAMTTGTAGVAVVTAGAINGIKFKKASGGGNLDAGTIKIYGIQ